MGIELLPFATLLRLPAEPAQPRAQLSLAYPAVLSLGLRRSVRVANELPPSSAQM